MLTKPMREALQMLLPGPRTRGSFNRLVVDALVRRELVEPAEATLSVMASDRIQITDVGRAAFENGGQAGPVGSAADEGINAPLERRGYVLVQNTKGGR